MHDELLCSAISARPRCSGCTHRASTLLRICADWGGELYRAVKARGFGASKVLLYAIEGALRDVPWQQLPAPLKEELNRNLGSELDN